MSKKKNNNHDDYKNFDISKLEIDAERENSHLNVDHAEKCKEIGIPYYADAVQAGFPSPAGDYIEKRLDLNELMVKRPAATFFVRAQGDSMIKAGIHSGDILVVDKSIEVSNNKIVIAVVDSELTVKRYRIIKDKHFLYAENDKFKPIEIAADSDFRVWGVVTFVIHKPD